VTRWTLPVDCPDCLNHYHATPTLLGACASAGITHGITTAEALRRYLNQYHARGHLPAERP
jgi:hypothetical protein